MKRTSSRNALPLALAVTLGMGISACSTSYDPPQIADELVWTSDGDDERPGWTAQSGAQEREGKVYFVGMADLHSTQRGARDAAMTDVRRLITQYAQTEVSESITTRESGNVYQDEIQNPRIVRERVTDEVAQFAVRQMKDNQWRYEQWLDKELEETFYTGFVQVSVDAAVFDVSVQRLSGSEVEPSVGSGGRQ